jgi:competence ComEA-like helix-hairpin-helix protein
MKILRNINTGKNYQEKVKESGVTLILVLAVLTILTLLGISFTFVMRTEMQAAGNFSNQIQANYLAEMGVTAAKNRLLSSREDNNGKLEVYSGLSTNSLGLKSAVNGIENPQVKVQDEESKINLAVALDTVTKDHWQPLDLVPFMAYRLNSVGFNTSMSTTILETLANSIENKEIKNMDDLRKLLGTPLYNALSDYVTLYSFESHLDEDGNSRVNIEGASAKKIYERLKDVMPKNLAAQLAVNIVDYRDDDSVPTLLTVDGTTYYGVEMTPYINEVMAWTPTPDDDGVDGQYVELYNPYSYALPIDGWRLDGSFGSVFLYGSVPANGYLIITNEYADDPDYDGGEADGYSYQRFYGYVSNLVEDNGLTLSKKGDTLKLYNEDDQLIDVLKYSACSRNVSWEKNDPRVNRVWQKSGGTPNSQNNACQPSEKSADFVNLQRHEDVAYHSLGDIAYVSLATPSTQWATAYQTARTGISFGTILDCLCMTDSTENRGAININTAPYEVLLALPGMTSDLAKAIISYRESNGSFATIADLLNVPGMTEPTDLKTAASSIAELEKDLYNFRLLSNWVSVRSYNFTIVSHARLTSGKKQLAESRILSLVNRTKSKITTVMEKRMVP